MFHLMMAAALLSALLPHEAAHAFAARRMGCELAALDGRISLNPRRHIDLFGTILLPLFLALAGSPFLVGYAKPVRVNPDNFRARRPGLFVVAAAGPAVNLLLAALAFPFVDPRALSGEPDGATFLFLFFLYNMLLALFNLIPLPPLDGSNLLRSALPGPLARLYILLEPALFLGLLFVIATGRFADLIRPLIEYLALRF